MDKQLKIIKMRIEAIDGRQRGEYCRISGKFRADGFPGRLIDYDHPGDVGEVIKDEIECPGCQKKLQADITKRVQYKHMPDRVKFWIPTHKPPKAKLDELKQNIDALKTQMNRIEDKLNMVIDQQDKRYYE